MPAVVMDGKALAEKMKERVRLRTEGMARKPGLAVVLVDRKSTRLNSSH